MLVSKLFSVVAVIFHPVALESKSEPTDAVAQILRPLLHPVQRVYHPCGGDEQYSALCHEDALQIRFEGLVIQASCFAQRACQVFPYVQRPGFQGPA